MLMKRREGSASRTRLQGIAAGLASGVLDRRTFLRRSGLTAGGTAALGLLPLGSVRKAEAGPQVIGAATELRKNVCTHCSVGCTVIAEVQNGVWVGQEPGWDSPINRGSHCAKGAAVRELVHGDRRLKYPMKLVNGEWQKISWDQAINEIGDKMLEIRAKSGADFGLSARLGEVLQRRRIPVPEVRGVLGHQLDRPPGPHLSLHHRRRCREHLGLWRDDELLQRHAQFEDHRLHGLERGRSASGVAAAHPDRQGDQPRQRVRARSALHAHGRACDRVCALPRRHRHRGDLGHAAPHLRQRLGGQAVHRPARLRHGPDQGRGGEVDAR